MTEKPKTFLFLTVESQYEIVAMDFKDACFVFSQTGETINNLMSVEEHSEPDCTDTIH